MVAVGRMGKQIREVTRRVFGHAKAAREDVRKHLRRGQTPAFKEAVELRAPHNPVVPQPVRDGTGQAPRSKCGAHLGRDQGAPQYCGATKRSAESPATWRDDVFQQPPNGRGVALSSVRRCLLIYPRRSRARAFPQPLKKPGKPPSPQRPPRARSVFGGGDSFGESGCGGWSAAH